MKAPLRFASMCFVTLALGGCGSDPGSDSGGVSSSDVSTTAASAGGPADLPSAVVYGVFTQIFSAGGRLSAVTAQLTRIHDLGCKIVWLMPVTPVGRAVNGHPAFDSPYSVHDYYAINPSYGTESDLVTLVSTAHRLGLQVILDEVLNHTAWDNALVTQHPEYYLHTDGNRHNPRSIAIAGNGAFADSAQLDYKTKPDLGLRKYVTDMLRFLIHTYDVDGFRFDTADDPFGNGRLIPADFWQGLRPQLEAVKPGILMLGEEEDPALARAPFELDYGWHLQGLYGNGGLRQVAEGASATLLEQAWQWQTTGWPAGMLHMTLLQDWDLPLDLATYGGTRGTMAAAVFNYTIDGVPLLYAGEEVGNDRSGFNTHTPIDWGSPNAASFEAFYRSLLELRNANPALQQGTLAWIANSDPAHVVSYTRSSGASRFLVVINFSGATASGTMSAPAATWKDVSPVGSPGGTAHALPPKFSLQPHDFAVFRAE